MALTDERSPEPAGNGDAPYNGSYERQPPQDVAAEQSVLGGMMLSKDAIADVVEVLRPNDFYRPAHQAIYDCILDLYGRGEPADAITVSAELERRQELVRVGGAPYMHTLIATVPTAANAGYYAEIVAEKAVLRRLVEAGTRIVQLGYHGSEGSAIDEVVDRAQAAIYDVTERRTSEDYAALEELLQPTMDEIDAIASRGGESLGIPTGFTDLDAVTNGLHPGQMIIVAARPGVGKALALSTPLPTPSGWTTMGEISVGDELIGIDGKPTEVVAATEVMHDRACYQVRFSDGTAVIADAEHQWKLASGRILTTQQLAELRQSHVVPAHHCLSLPARDLPVPPYSLGAWLVAGNATDGTVDTDDPELREKLLLAGLAQDGAEISLPQEISAALRELGVWSRRSIPPNYLRGSEQQRRELLAGLLDASAEVAPGGTIRLATSEEMVSSVRELVLTLGYACTATPPLDDSGATEFDGSVLVFDSGTDEVFRLGHKNEQHKKHRADAGRPARLITSVHEVGSEPVRCVEVDAPDHLYLVSKSLVPTHNSTLGLDFARSASIKHGLASVIFSLEMGRTEIVMRMLSAEARIRLGDMRGGRMTDDDWTRLARRMSEISEAPLFIDDSPNLTMMEIRAKARRLKQRSDISLVVVDYMQLMTSGKKVESRQQEVSEFSRNLKLLAKELEVPVVAISQLNRGPEQRTDKKPQLSDLRESGCLTAGTRLLRADTGAQVSFGELMETGERPLVWSVDERMRIVARPITNVFSSGVKEVFKVRLASGREVEATANHPMLTVDGWHPLGALCVGSRVGAPRHVPEPLGSTRRPESEVIALASEIGNEQSLPEWVFALPREQIALLLRHVWAEAGWAYWDAHTGEGCVYATAPNRRIADDLSQLLLRLGVFAKTAQASGARRLVAVDDSENQLRFLETANVRIVSLPAVVLRHKLRELVGRTNGDTVPDEVWNRVRTLLASRSMTRRDRVSGNRATAQASTGSVSSASGERLGSQRTRLARAKAALHDAELDMLATNDVFWDEIVEITALGEQPVFDATVHETHNFVADSVVMHNSLEQDADMVLLIHRPDAFERDDPRMGEADLILAKHRAGPVTTVTVAHQLHYSRFVDMAQE